MRVLNHKTDKIPPGAVWIMRPGPWGNHYWMRYESEREMAVEQHRIWLWQRIRDSTMQTRLKLLSTATALVCCCSPKRCHGDNLVDAMEYLGYLPKTKLFYEDGDCGRGSFPAI